MEHTKGPWIVETRNRDRWTVFSSIFGTRVCNTYEMSAHTTWEEQAANATLIAAAPEMLEALIIAERQLRDSHDGKRADDENIMNTLNVVQAAIRKAQGGK